MIMNNCWYSYRDRRKCCLEIIRFLFGSFRYRLSTIVQKSINDIKEILSCSLLIYLVIFIKRKLVC